MDVSLNRRAFLKNSLAGALLAASPTLYAKTLISDAQGQQGWFAAQGDKAHGFGYGGLTHPAADRNAVHEFDGLSGFRGHGGAQHPLEKHRIFLFGRRPSTESIEIDLNSGKVVNRIQATKDRHFFGHGAFSADGRYLFTTEADLKNNVGKIGIRDAHSFQHLGEYDSYGVGPHQLMLMPDNKQLVIANGGILTRPESGRKKLNLDTMQSNLALVDIENGSQNEQVTVTEPKASIRHLDVSNDGTIAFGMQVQREACGHDRIVPLTASYHAKTGLQMFAQPEMVLQQMDDYVGSVAVNSESRLAGFTSPHGDIVGFWHIDTGEFSGYHALQDVCGIVNQAASGEFAITNSFGMVRMLDAMNLNEKLAQRKHLPGMKWDNHMVAIHS
ncbi:DUF1513 domain-containing protein [Thiomicrorhabdus sediminis]|nr:DUF1513 domain-containing protein [Thiomicrorhabdus sediminis]